MPPLVVAMTGATGAVYGIRLLEVLRDAGVQTHLVMSLWAERTIVAETDRKPVEVARLATKVWTEHDLTAPIASASFPTRGMVVAPCSMRSLAAVATGMSENLIHRAADATLEARGKLVLLVRESPLSVIHLENMLRAARAGAVIAPPMPAFYARPRRLDEMVDHTVGRVLDQFGLELSLVRRWGQRRIAKDSGAPEDSEL
jgi:4-hydroxy-3-polyprenylbenzoate decarboxylase